jgi:hypothetical protein
VPESGLTQQGEVVTESLGVILEILRHLEHWLANTALSATIQNVAWIIPATQAIHILCVALVMAAIFIVDLRILGVLARTQTLSALSDRFLTWIWYLLPVLFLSGAILIVGEPGRALLSPMFGAKMLMLVLAALLTLAFQRPLRHAAEFWNSSPKRRVAVQAIAVLSLVLWTCIVFAGRWIAYVASL